MDISQTHKRLGQLLPRAWQEYDRLNACPLVVRPAIPILFFGDSKRYLASPYKVVTVGLNPSREEFPRGGGFSRFPETAAMATDSSQRDESRHLAALDSYFHCNPYKAWFSSFQPILSAMGSSFYEGCESAALHTDLCSPIATDPTWSKLSKATRADMAAEGVAIWHSLIRTLAPDVILMSVARKYVDQIEFPLGTRRVVLRVDRKHPYEAWACEIEIDANNPSLLVFGDAAQLPFGKISNFAKSHLGLVLNAERIQRDSIATARGEAAASSLIPPPAG